MLHIVVNCCAVLKVYELADTPDKPSRELKLEEDYKVERCMDNEDVGEPITYSKDGWVIPAVYKGKSMHGEEAEKK